MFDIASCNIRSLIIATQSSALHENYVDLDSLQLEIFHFKSDVYCKKMKIG